MSERKSIADRMPFVLVELQTAFETSSDDPNRFMIWRLRNAAAAALEAGMTTAGEIIEAAKAIKRTPDDGSAEQT